MKETDKKAPTIVSNESDIITGNITVIETPVIRNVKTTMDGAKNKINRIFSLIWIKIKNFFRRCIEGTESIFEELRNRLPHTIIGYISCLVFELAFITILSYLVSFPGIIGYLALFCILVMLLSGLGICIGRFTDGFCKGLNPNAQIFIGSSIGLLFGILSVIPEMFAAFVGIGTYSFGALVWNAWIESAAEKQDDKLMNTLEKIMKYSGIYYIGRAIYKIDHYIWNKLYYTFDWIKDKLSTSRLQPAPTTA